ncbi:MAG: M15 family metallopeptidase [Bdellovibrionales bacterium]|nr:M15 family metallopeptidase [Bdellovibrionales bacterium]
MALLTSTECVSRYGAAYKESNMVLWDVPSELEIGVIPKRIYCNKDMLIPLTLAFKALISTGYVKELKTFDGCFNIRQKRGGVTQSLHSWGVAIDVNAAWNGLGKTPTLSQGFVKCFTDNGFDWGGHWNKPDGMHFQLKSFK